MDVTTGKIPVLLYYGKTDTACDYVGGLTMAETISWSGRENFASMPLSSWDLSEGVTAGQSKSYGGLTFIQVSAAGHMVPLDQPAAADAAIRTLLKQI